MGEDLGFGQLLDEQGFFARLLARLLARSPPGAGGNPPYGPDLPLVLSLNEA
ncbi:hypothetical protein ABIE67_007302 [Streptomyces sp. V4I8]|uniref:hypothetical protein n=1 Tax=Streptomyces sp. V4I8 TaxID=3156469 RepID=UPI0035141A42